MNIHWPQISRYCGCCELKTGLFTGGIIQLVLTAFVCLVDVNMFVAASQIKNYANMYVITAELHKTDLKDDMPPVEPFVLSCDLFKLVLGRFIVREILNCIVLISTIVLFHGVYKKTHDCLEFFLYVNRPIWLVLTMFTVCDVFFLAIPMKVLTTVYALHGAYYLLAVRSYHKTVTGQSKLYSDINRDLENTVVCHDGSVSSIEPPPYDETEYNTQIAGNIRPRLERSEVQMNSPVEINSCEVSGAAKKLNFTEAEIVYDRTQLTRTHPLFYEPQSSSGREIAVNDSLNEHKTAKGGAQKDALENQPVIYDHNQLEIGGSSIIDSTRI